MKKRIFRNIDKKLLFIVVAALILNFSAVSTYALYRTTMTGTGTIDTATWTVSQVGDKNNVTLTSGGEETYTVTVSSSAETDVKYSIVVSNIPNDVQIKLDCGNYITVVNNQVTFTDVGRLLYGGTTTRNHVITFKSSIDQDEVSAQAVTMNVDFEQDLCTGSNCNPEVNPAYTC